jgi:hypothetical protein
LADVGEFGEVDRGPASPGGIVSDQLRVPAWSAVATAVPVVGATVVFFVIVGGFVVQDVMQDLPMVVAIPLGIPVLISPFLVAGGAWGWGMARLVNAPRWPAIRTGSLTLTGMILLLEFPVHMSQALPVPGWMPLGIHGAFTVVFMAEIALVAGVASARLSRRLGFAGSGRSLGVRVGGCGAAGFLAGSLLSLALGFRVGTWPPANMVWALFVAQGTAGLAAGWVLGRSLVGETEPLVTGYVGSGG